MKKKWYAIYTRSHCEKKVAALLSRKKIENYCPLNRIENCQGGKKKFAYEPLFPSFVFVYITDAEIAKIRQIHSVVNFIYWLTNLAIINNSEIENIQHFTNRHSNIKIEKTSVNPNGFVRIISDPIVDINIDRNMMSVKNSNIKVLLPSLGFIMMAEIEKSINGVFDYGFDKRSKVS